MTVRLHKLHATGNDFLVWPQLEPGTTVAVSPATARALCDRRTGIGADGLILLTPGLDGADATMTLHNADGELAEMSGNGIRCLARVAADHGLGSDDRLVVDTGAGRRLVQLGRDTSGQVRRATVDMGPVTFDPAAIPVDAPSPFDLQAEFHGVEYRGDAAGMGNPHFVLFVDDVDRARVAQHGPHLETDPRFPNRTNVEFVALDLAHVTDLPVVQMRVWERGVGETRSCGTGACAAAAVAHRRGLVGDRVLVRVPGGYLDVELGDTIQLGGPVVAVFTVDLEPGDGLLAPIEQGTP